MTREEMWKEFENQLIRETRTSMTMSFDSAERMTKLGIEETVAKWKKRLEQTRWIPVSERLPDDHDWYVIVVKEKSTGYQYIPRIASHNHDNCWSIIDTEDADKEWLDDLECIAWMPLPQPYK